jgi:uncharacterized protein (TIGR03435 family)
MFIRFLPGGGLRFTWATLRNLISIAYNVRPCQISGGPKWIDTVPFDIGARLTTSGAAPATRDDMRKALEALRSLLAGRFLLTFHQETASNPRLHWPWRRAVLNSRSQPKSNPSYGVWAAG